MRLSLVEELAFGLAADNSLLAQSVASGVEIEPAQIVELMANTRSLYALSTLLSRDFGRIDQCHALWQQTAKQFERLCQAWDGVPPNGDATAFHRAQLSRLRELARDRCELYSVAESERLIHAANREPGLGLEFRPFSERAD